MLGSSVYWMWGEPAIKTANFNPLKWASLERVEKRKMYSDTLEEEKIHFFSVYHSPIESFLKL